MRVAPSIVALFALVALAVRAAEPDEYSSPRFDPGAVHFAEHFDDPEEFGRRWVVSEAKKDGADEQIAKYDGEWRVEAPLKPIFDGDLGLALKSKAKHAAIAAKLDRPFAFEDRPLVVQYEATMQEGQECGGAYLKLLSAGEGSENLERFRDSTPYTIMFGPDKCGNDHKLHFIFRHRNPLSGALEEKHCKKPKDRFEEPFKDKRPHLYTLVLRPDGSFSTMLDLKEINSGSLLEDFSPPVNPPEEIDDPDDFKPSDWDDREKIPDPTASKPEDWDESAPPRIPDPDARKPDGWLDDEPETIPDPAAEKPADWDVDMDGEWEAPLVENPKCADAPGCGEWSPPLVPNPSHRGVWKAPLVPNPRYRGEWTPRKIPNPDRYRDDEPFKMTAIAAVGFELWSMSPSLLFDNIIVTDDPETAFSWARRTFHPKIEKLDADSASRWGRVMRALNYKPGWWALYFVYCSVPVAFYVRYLCRRLNEEKDDIKKESDSKKTDAVVEDEPPVSEESDRPKASTKDDEGSQEEDYAETDTKERVEERIDDAENQSGEEASAEVDTQSNMPRRRKLRKE